MVAAVGIIVVSGLLNVIGFQFLLKLELDIAIRKSLPEHDPLFVGDRIPRQI